MMRFPKWLVKLLMLVVLSIHAGCSSSDENMFELHLLENMNKEKAGEVRQLIFEELDIGADARQIEAFFERHNITYSYDRFNQSYNGIIRDVVPVVGQAIIISIYVDDERRFKRADVEDSFFTSPGTESKQ